MAQFDDPRSNAIKPKEIVIKPPASSSPAKQARRRRSSYRRTMNTILNLHKITTKTGAKKKPTFTFLPLPRSPLSLLLISLFALLFFLFLISFPATQRITPRRSPPKFCTLSHGEKFFWYAPHSGFSNQLSEFKNGLLMAGILNRTLVIPPVLDHHAVVLGSCPKFRVAEPKEIRKSVWDHSVGLIKSGRYVSMADILDISSLVPSSVRVIDFRVFASLWCDVKEDLSCANDLNAESSLFDHLEHCGSLASGFGGNIEKCLYAVDEDCRTTVWTYDTGEDDGALDSFQPDEQQKKKKKISYVRVRRKVYKTLGPSSEAGLSTVLAFGSLFTSPYKGSQLYIDIHEAQSNQRIQSLQKQIEFLPFVPEIISAGKNFAMQTIKAPFLCAQLRLLDGQFKNHWKTTFLGLKQKLEFLKGTTPQPIHIFLMTDLPQHNWTSTYLGKVANDSNNFKLHFLQEGDDLVIKTAEELVASAPGLRFGSGASRFGQVNKAKVDCPNRKIPEILLYIEESVCSCASLGFVGTAGSTIADSIELMRNNNVCASMD